MELLEGDVNIGKQLGLLSGADDPGEEDDRDEDQSTGGGSLDGRELPSQDSQGSPGHDGASQQPQTEPTDQAQPQGERA